MLFSKSPPINILFCNICKGAGHIKLRKCPECKGMCLGRFARRKFLYWGEPFTYYRIALRQGRRILNKFRFFGALILTLGFLGVFVWQVEKLALWKEIFTSDFWHGGRLVPLVFWLFVICFSYLLYRIIVMEKILGLVEPYDYKEKKSTPFEEEHTLQTWAQVLKLSRKKRKDISAVFTAEAQQILEQTYLLTYKYRSASIAPEHLFYILLSSMRVSSVFIRLGVPMQVLQARLAKLFVPAKEKILPLLSSDVQQIVFQAYELAYNLRQEYVNVTELLVATVRQSEVLQELLYDFNIDPQKLANAVEWLRVRERLKKQYQRFRRAAARRSKYGLDRAMTAVATPFLNSFSEDLTIAAKFGYLSPCVARDKEIEEIFRIIEGGRQSVILVGERGVGKMSIIEGIAQKMIEENVPKRLHDKRLVQLSTSALLAGTTVSGAQERLIRIMHEVGRAKNIILFIKNIHDLVGVTDTGKEGVDISETLAEYLGPGKFLTFATTTTESYNREVVNTELGKVLSRVDIKEMDENQAIQVLESKVGYVEYKHNVFFSYDALAQCVKQSKRFLHDQNLPDSAIQIMTEVASYVHHHKGENQLVTAEDVAAVISEKTGVPTTAVSENESQKLLRLEQEMHQRVIGQDEAVTLVANALRRARVEIRSTSKPIANFLFLGPTGVGKTELAKTIAEVYFGGEQRMIRIDMSEYQDKSGIYRLIGQPGQQGTGLLTEAVRQRPFSLVLLDEMEKADSNVLNLFLQVFDDGRLTDSTGRVIDFTNAIIIATSNAGTTFVQEQIRAGTVLEEIRQKLIKSELKQYYKPEFLNRFDGIVLFKPLGKEEIKQVASLMLKRVAKDLEKRGVELRVEESALEFLSQVGFEPEFGARPMRRAIQDKVENKLAEMILEGKLERRDTVVIGEKGELRVENKQ